MTVAASIYDDLIGGGLHPLGNGFDVHVAASAVAIAMAEAQTGGRPLTQTLGLDAVGLSQLADAFFPPAKARLLAMVGDGTVAWQADEDCLRDLLIRFSSGGTGYQRVLADIIARRAQGPNHLWQDLGLQDRAELTGLMRRHFAPLKERNVRDMKWKKFLYRTICRDEGYGFCAAPTCGECDDYHICFDEERGDSLLGVGRDRSVAALPHPATMP